jgi:hypothetical protein
MHVGRRNALWGHRGPRIIQELDRQRRFKYEQLDVGVPNVLDFKRQAPIR